MQSMQIQRLKLAILVLAGITLIGIAGAQTRKNHPTPQKSDGNSVQVSLPVTGSGTPGRITKWTGSNSTTNTVGESAITEDKFGNTGVGTDAPTSKLTVAGTIESTQGGVKFPDGSIQTTAGISSVAHDITLAGNGTAASPLGIAPGGVGTLQIANAAVTGLKISAAAVGTLQLADAAVTGPKIAGGAVGNLQLADASVSGGKIAAGAVGTFQLAGAAVTGPKIATGAVGNLQLADAAVTGAKIATGAIGTPQITDGAVTGPKIAIASVGTTQLSDSAITSPKLASGAVQTIHLADSSVTSSRIASGQVVKTLNGLSDNVQLVAGSNITLTPSGNTLTISGTGQSGSTASQAFQVTGTLHYLDPPFILIQPLQTTFQVPQGQRLVIEYVSARALTVFADPECTFSLKTSINGQQPAIHYIPAASSIFNTVNGDRLFVIGQATKIYADGAVTFSFTVFPATQVDVDFTISGYLVNLQ